MEEAPKDSPLDNGSPLQAVADLSSDDARDLFTESFNFEHKQRYMHSGRRSQASKLLSAVAQRSRTYSLPIWLSVSS